MGTENKEEINVIGKLSAEELNGISANQKVMEVIVEDINENGDVQEIHYCYFKRPSIQTLSAMNKISKTDEIKGVQVFTNECFITGSKAWEDDGKLFMGLSGAVVKAMESVKVRVKNL